MVKHKSDGRHVNHFERKMNSYDRRPGRILPGRCILIVCEGAETEPNYFNSLRSYLRLSNVQVIIKEHACAPITVVEEAKDLVKKRKRDIRNGAINQNLFEDIWCVFDVENPHYNSSFYRAVEIADQCGFQLGISNPAFEFWYLLHFKFTTRPFANGVEIKNYLKQYIPGYHPSMSVFDNLVTLLPTAIISSKRILQN